MMNRFSRPSTTFRLAAIVMAIAAPAAPAHAGRLVSYSFSGVIDDSETSRVDEGTPFSGTITYDLDAVDLSEESINTGLYEFLLPDSAPVGFTYTIGERLFAADELAELIVYDDRVTGEGASPFDFFSFRGDAGGGVEGRLVEGYVDLIGPSSVFSSDRPPAALRLSDFEFAQFTGSILVRVPSPRGGFRLVPYSFSGPIDSLTLLVSVPEPSGLVLMGIGGVAVLAMALRRTRGDRAALANR